MKTWWSPKEMVDAGLAGMPTTVRAINVRAGKEGWAERRNLAGEPLARPRQGRGGGLEYHVSLLPDEAQVQLVKARTREALAAPAAKKPSSAIWETFESQPDRQKQKARDRLQALMDVEALIRGGLQKNIAVSTIAAQRGVSTRSIYNWYDLVVGHDESDWLPLLAPKHAGRHATVPCDPAAWAFFKADYLRLAQPSLESCYRRLQMTAEENGWTIPSSRTLHRRIEQEIPAAVHVLLREGQEKLKRLYPAQERDRSSFHALQAVNMDGHKWDVFVRWPEDNTVARPIMVAIQDLYSGKILAWRIDRTENADSVRLACMDMFRAYGIPDEMSLDNGRAFASKFITGGATNRFRFKVKPEEPTGILTAMGVKLHWTTPYSGQSKPIERAFRDLCDTVAKHPAFEGAYTGNSPDAKPENYGSRAVPLETFLEVVDQGIRMHNAQAKRRSRVCQGIYSFDDVFAASYQGALIKRASEAQLRMCQLAAENVRANTEDGSINWAKNRYWAEFLLEVRGTALTIRFDPDDLQSGIDVYRLDGTFIGRAECIAAVGFSDQAAARDHSQKRRKFIRATKDAAALGQQLSRDELLRQMPKLDNDDEPFIPAAVRLAPHHRNAAALAVATRRQPEELPEFEDVSEHWMAGLRLISDDD